MIRTVYGIVSDQDRADRLGRELHADGFAPDRVAVIARKPGGAALTSAGETDSALRSIGTGAATGGVVGGALGWVIGLTALTVPGVGPILAAGPLLAALGGALAGAASGVLAGALTGLGMPDEQASRYEAAVVEGAVVVAIRVGDDDEERRARLLLEREHAQRIATVEGAPAAA